MANSFARGGLIRSSANFLNGRVHRRFQYGRKHGCRIKCTQMGETMDRPGLIRAMVMEYDTLPKLVVVSELLNAIIDYSSTHSNISMNLKQSFLKLLRSVQAACKERNELETTLLVDQRTIELTKQEDPGLGAHRRSQRSQKRARYGP